MPSNNLLTHDGYPAVKTSDGKHMTEYSITVTDPRMNGGKPTNIPSLWKGKVVDEDTAVDNAIASKKEYRSFDSIDSAVSDSIKKSSAGGANAPEKYAMGGSVQAETDRMLAEGGIMQQGNTVDPVSGNDVPPGAMQEEVRDDIDAKLSEGEFVIPADVVRYIGLSTLMKLRDKAKEGLQKMQDIGQMGNAEEVSDPEALHSEDSEMDDESFGSEIDSILGEEAGGMPQPQPAFAAGGYVDPESVTKYKTAPFRGFEMVKMTNAEGNTIFIPHSNGRPLLSVPAGYSFKLDTLAPAVVTADPATKTTTTDSTDSGGGGNAYGSDGNSSSGGGLSMGSTQSSGSVSSGQVGVVATAMGMLGVPGMGLATIGKGVIAEALNSISYGIDSAANVSSVAAAMGLSPSQAADPAYGAAISAAIDSAPNGNESMGNTATTGVDGTGGAAASAAADAAAAATAAGHSDAAVGAASQAAADAAVSGQSSSAAAAAGAAAAASADGVGSGASGGPGSGGAGSGDDGTGGGDSGASGGPGSGGAGSGDDGTGGGDSGASGGPGSGGAGSGDDGTGGGDSGDGGDGGDGGGDYAKGGFVTKRKKTVTKTNKGLASRK
jgi:hypothetical protein